MLTNPRQKSNAGGTTTHNLKLYYRGRVTTTVWCLHKNQTCRPIEQNRRPRNQPTQLQTPVTYSLQSRAVTFDEGSTIYAERKTVSLANGAGETEFTCRKMKPDSIIHPAQKSSQN